MNNKQLNQSVEDILNEFGLSQIGDCTIELFDLIRNLEGLVKIYANRVGEEPQEEDLNSEDGIQKAFLRTAWSLARISRLYGKGFYRVQRRYPDFDLKLHKAAMSHVDFLKKEHPEHYASTMSGYSWHADEVYYYDA